MDTIKAQKVYPEYVAQICPNCNGRGTVGYDARPCPTCGHQELKGIILVPAVVPKDYNRL